MQLSDLVLSEMRLMRRDAERLLAKHRELLPRYNEVSVGGAAIDPLSRGEALHTFLNSLGFMSPEDALTAAKETARLFIRKHNDSHSRDYVVLRSEEQDDSYLWRCFDRIKRAESKGKFESGRTYEYCRWTPVPIQKQIYKLGGDLA